MEPETRYAGGIAIAYQTVGDGGRRAHEALRSTQPARTAAVRTDAA